MARRSRGGFSLMTLLIVAVAGVFFGPQIKGQIDKMFKKDGTIPPTGK